MSDNTFNVAEKAVLYIGGFELPDKNAAAQRVISNGKILRQLGYSVYYLGVGRTLSRQQMLETKATFDEFEHYNVNYPVGLVDWIKYLSSITEVLKLAGQIKNLEFIVAYNYPAIALARLNRWCTKRNIRLIADCTEWYAPQGRLLFKIIKGFDTYLRMRIIHPRLDGIIVISKYLYSFYAKRMTYVILLPPLVDSKADKWENNCTNSSENVVLVYAGSPGAGSKDRLDTILDALSKTSIESEIRFSLHVIGLTKQQYINDFGVAYLPPALETHVFFKGRLSHIETLDQVKCADYTIFVRDNNLVNTAGFPTKFVEAISCGTPVLTNESSNIIDYLRTGENGYILDNSSTETLVQTLEFALSQKREKIDEMKMMIKRANTFDYRHYIKPVNAFLESINSKSINLKKF